MASYEGNRPSYPGKDWNPMTTTTQARVDYHGAASRLTDAAVRLAAAVDAVDGDRGRLTVDARLIEYRSAKAYAAKCLDALVAARLDELAAVKADA